MARLIDANAIENGIAVYVAENAYLNDTALDALRKVEEWIDESPTVDAVEVVHCKDCKHCYKSYGSSTGYRCKVWGIYDTDCEVTPEHYCSYGERKDND